MACQSIPEFCAIAAEVLRDAPWFSASAPSALDLEHYVNHVLLPSAKVELDNGAPFTTASTRGVAVIGVRASDGAHYYQLCVSVGSVRGSTP